MFVLIVYYRSLCLIHIGWYEFFIGKIPSYLCVHISRIIALQDNNLALCIKSHIKILLKYNISYVWNVQIGFQKYLRVQKNSSYDLQHRSSSSHYQLLRPLFDIYKPCHSTWFFVIPWVLNVNLVIREIGDQNIQYVCASKGTQLIYLNIGLHLH